jgi:alkylation response protein AidB-like acyl-CoA dehydrogenase
MFAQPWDCGFCLPTCIILQVAGLDEGEAMEFGFSRAQEMLRNMVREYAEKEVAPKVESYSQEGDEFPYETLKRCAQLGLIGLLVPKKYGGTEMGYLARMIAIEEISKVYAGLGANLRGWSLVPYLLMAAGTEEQRQKYLPPLCSGEIQGSIATTEASSGSDFAAFPISAVKDGDDYIINCRKVMISRSTVSDVFGVLVRSAEGYHTFLIEPKMPGVKTGHLEKMISTTSKNSPTGDLVISNCRVSKEYLVGKEGKGVASALSTITAVGRTGGAAVCLGVAQGAFDIAVKYAKERILYGKPLHDLQSIKFMLSDMATRIECSKLLCYQMSWLQDQGKKPVEMNKETSMAKLYASETAMNNVLKAIEILGGYGTAPEFGLIQRLKTALDMIAAAGSNNVLRRNIGDVVVA